MKCTVELVRCDSKLVVPATTMWDIAFEVSAEDYPTQYIPITIYSYELNVVNDASAVQLAAARCIPQQIGLLYDLERTKPTPEPEPEPVVEDDVQSNT